MQKAELPDFALTAEDAVSQAFRARNMQTFSAACAFIQQLPYGRNADKTDVCAVFSDQCGTCSTKHAVLKHLADAHVHPEIALVLGMYRMNGINTPPVADTLHKHGLAYLPEAHCYLKHNGLRFDFTWPVPPASDFADDLLEEIVISPSQISSEKVALHQRFLAQWLADNSSVSLTLPALWQIREQCIQDLANA